MTREERHIAVLNRLLENMDVYDSIQPTTERKKAIEAAIQALSQEPCDDAISRKAVLSVIGNVKPHNYEQEDIKQRILNVVSRTPSVTQKSGKWDRLYNWLNDMRLGIVPDETVYDDTERVVRESQVDIIDEIMEWIEKADMRGAE